MSLFRFVPFLLLIFTSQTSEAQTDSVFQNLQQFPEKYFPKLDTKIDKYSNRITGKTEKTLTKLGRWENKIKSLLQKANPEAATRLFGEGKMTFTSLLKKLKEGQEVADGYRSQYNEYRDKLNTNLRYIETQKKELNAKLIQPVKTTSKKLNELEDEIKNTEVIEQFIKQRKKQLIDESLKYLGKNKYLTKINKEAYYYTETLRNYKEIFSDPVKFENLLAGLLKKIPSFNDFFNNNNGLSTLLQSGTGPLAASSGNATNYSALGYQSNASIVQNLQQRNLSAPNIQQLTQTNANALNSPLQELKNRFPNLNSTEDMPDFKPNEMKSKTFKQRLEPGANLQFGKATNFLPGTADIALQMAYNLNSKSSVGLGTVYKLGLGSSINNIKLSFAGIGLRSFLDWKLKGNFFANGGFEYNYNTTFKSIRDLPSINSSAISLWKPAALLGINKKYNAGKMKGNMMVLYDFLAKQKLPQTQSIVFRIGYNF
ncbi:hypothetical protein [Ferruginibacter sp.]|nr:hypothetical protein [Ferruginibacter sp.]